MSFEDDDLAVGSIDLGTTNTEIMVATAHNGKWINSKYWPTIGSKTEVYFDPRDGSFPSPKWEKQLNDRFYFSSNLFRS